MEIDFSTIDDAEDFSPLPPGRYVSEIVHAELRNSSNGNPQINLRLEVIDGPHKGRRFFDNLTFSSGAMKRSKLVMGRLGFDVRGALAFEPEDFVGKRARVELEIEPYTDKEGVEKKRNKVPFSGYETLASGDMSDDGPVVVRATPPPSSEPLPF